MTGIAAPPSIPGTPIDPPPKEAPQAIRELDASDGAAVTAVGVGYRAVTRFNYARSTLLAAGTTYYVFLAMFSLIALGYGITALVGADRLADYLTRAISEAFPGLLGEEGLDPAELRAVGQAASFIGLAAMLYAGGGAMVAASGSIHLIYGAPPDSRNYVMKRVRLLGWLAVIGPLIAFSLVAGTVTANLGNRVLGAIGWEGTQNRIVLGLAGVLVTLAADFLVVYLLLGRLGGIRPPRKALVTGSAAGALVIQVLRIPMALVVEFSLDKPQYGALAVPIGVLLVLYLNSLTVYGAAALTAGVAERDVPVEEIVPSADAGRRDAD